MEGLAGYQAILFPGSLGQRRANSGPIEFGDGGLRAGLVSPSRNCAPTAVGERVRLQPGIGAVIGNPKEGGWCRRGLEDGQHLAGAHLRPDSIPGPRNPLDSPDGGPARGPSRPC